ncbi:MAG: adenylate/guanylate cyclase domain-containing protein [Burkholderiales bacterium]|nr:adenylate/guanylate cyclase domain-containing protein [Burkholderiales bacterium]
MTDSPFRQRLAAILAADAAGYSRLMAVDEAATVAALDAARAVFRAQIEAHRGRVIDMAGDSVLAVFDTAIGAVSAALAVQGELAAAASAQPEETRMRFRIGVHLGDVIEKGDGTVYGDGVNIAARLQGLAEAGGVTVSAAVQGAVRGKLAASFADQGEQAVKNIPHPVRAFAVHPGEGGDAGPAPATPAPALAPPTMLSIAVLPFDNMSGDPEQDYFADGMVEDIITALARMRTFFVIARNSSFVYKGRAVDIKQVGRELGVRYVLEGSVRRSGNRVRITGQLIEAENGHHVWADRFDGTLEDVFDLQDRITDSIVSAVQPNLLRAEIARARVKPTANLQAYDLLLRAMPGLLPGSTRAEQDEAASFLRQALEKDPRYTTAKAMSAFACLRRLGDGYGGAEDVKEGLRHADEALAEARDDPTVLSYAGLTLASIGYRALGFRVLGFRYDEALRAIERALSLSPNLLSVQFCAGFVKCVVGDAEASLLHFERAVRMSPLDPGMSAYVALSGGAHLMLGRYEEALASAERAIHDSPEFVLGHRLKVTALGHLGRIDESRLAAQRLLELTPQFTVSQYRSVSPFKDAGLRARICDAFLAAGVPK